MPPSLGRHPPESPVPAPRATNGRLSRFASFTIAETCWLDVGKTTKSASALNRVSPSDSYTISSSGSESTAPWPTIDSSSRRSSRFLESVSADMEMSGLYRADEHPCRPRDRRGVDAVVAIEIGSRARLPEVVHAQRLLGDAERGPAEGQGGRRAVQHGHGRHAFWVGPHEIREVRPWVAQAPVEAVRARDGEDAREDARLAERAGGLYRLGHGDACGEDADRVRLGIPTRHTARVDQPIGAPQDVVPVRGARRECLRLVDRAGREP